MMFMKHRAGRIEVICGSMFSGKTEELIRRIRRAEIANQKVQVFKHQFDDRYDEIQVKTHSGQGLHAVPVKQADAIREYLDPETTVVAIDEGQFFDDDVVDLTSDLANHGIRVIISGLDLDFRGEPFGPMPHLMSLAEEVQKLHAICMECGEEASRTQRLVNGKPADYDDPIIMVGAAESYEARCREHHEVPRRNGYQKPQT
jgi:thymidine kinase